jgi:hypothetical protein
VGVWLHGELWWVDLLKKRTHGIDLLSKFDDPYAGGQAVIIECKNRQMQSITAASVNEWTKELINNVECAQSAIELSSTGIDASVLSTGLLLIHANDGAYDESKIDGILKGIALPARRNPINVFVATNREINMWTSLFRLINNSFASGELSFVYPSINGHSKVHSKTIPINALYSKFLFAEYKYDKTFEDGSRKGTEAKTSHIMFSFDDISSDSFRYMWSMFKYFQMQGADDYVFCFYPRKAIDTQLLTKENFISAILRDQNGAGITESDKIKVGVIKIDNRMLSPVDTLG